MYKNGTDRTYLRSKGLERPDNKIRIMAKKSESQGSRRADANVVREGLGLALGLELGLEPGLPPPPPLFLPLNPAKARSPLPGPKVDLEEGLDVVGEYGEDEREAAGEGDGEGDCTRIVCASGLGRTGAQGLRVFFPISKEVGSGWGRRLDLRGGGGGGVREEDGGDEDKGDDEDDIENERGEVGDLRGAEEKEEGGDALV